MALTVKFSDFHGEVFAWTSGLPLISESTAQSYEANDSQYYSYTTITMEGIDTDSTDSGFYHKLYNLCVSGVTGTLEIGNREYFGYFSNFTSDGNEPSSVRWTMGIPYVIEFSTFPNSNLYDSSYSSTWETMPYDQTYGPVYKVTQTATSAGTLIQKGDDLSACSNRSLSGVVRAFDSINTWYTSKIQAGVSYFGYELIDYDFYDLQGTIDFDEITGSFSLSLSWLMKDRQENSPAYDKPYHIVSSSTSKISSDFKRTYQKKGTIQGFATGEFPTALPAFDAVDCKPKSNNLGFSKDDRYKHALMGFDTISSTIQSTVGTDLLPDDKDWHGGQYFSKDNAPALDDEPAQSQIGYNPYAGTITYDYTYDDQPASVISDAITEAISSRDKSPGSTYEQIQVIGRRHGPLIRESVVGYDVGVKSITYEGIFPRNTTLKKYSFKQSIMDDIDNYVEGFAPDSSTYNVSIVEDKTDLTLTSNKVIRSITWNYSKCPT